MIYTAFILCSNVDKRKAPDLRGFVSLPSVLEIVPTGLDVRVPAAYLYQVFSQDVPFSIAVFERW
jgi:hypothetical protein